MVFESSVQSKIDFIDSILSKLGQVPILSNSDFEEGELLCEWYVPLILKGALNRPYIAFLISTSGMDIIIDRVSECYSWGNEDIEKHKFFIEETIEILLSKYIKVEYCGEKYTKISCLDSTGKSLRSVKGYTGIVLWKSGCTEKIYPPIYQKVSN